MMYNVCNLFVLGFDLLYNEVPCQMQCSPFPQEVSPGIRDGRIRAQKVNTSALLALRIHVPHHSCAFTLPTNISGHQLCALLTLIVNPRP